MNFDKLNQRFSKIREEWQQDTQIDFQFKNKEYSEDLARLALEIPFQHNKYLNYYTDLSQVKTSLEFEVRRMVKEKREYYGGEAEAKVYAEKPFGTSIKTAEKMKVYMEADMAALSAPLAGRPMMEGVTIKAYPGLDTSQAPIAAVLEAREAHGGPVDDIAAVTLTLTESPMVQQKIEDPALKNPTNRETADHSLTYLAAAALLEGEVTEAQYARALWEDPRVKELMGRITMEMDATWEARAPGAYPCSATIATRSGAEYRADVAYAPGHACNPMDAEGVVAKFRRSVAGHMDEARAAEIIALVMDMDELPTLRPLMKALTG